MDLLLKRSYDPLGCNGRLYCKGRFVCFTIELPWKCNRRNQSCIPEGRYPLYARNSLKWGYHVGIDKVPGRSAILFHPANYAQQQLRGCIAPVSSLSGIGIGNRSSAANDRLKGLILPVLESKEKCFLTIKSECYEKYHKKGHCPHA